MLTEKIKRLRFLEKSKRELDDEIELQRNLIMQEMIDEGLKQIKTDEETVSIAKRVSYNVNELRFKQ